MDEFKKMVEETVKQLLPTLELGCGCSKPDKCVLTNDKRMDEYSHKVKMEIHAIKKVEELKGVSEISSYGRINISDTRLYDENDLSRCGLFKMCLYLKCVLDKVTENNVGLYKKLIKNDEYTAEVVRANHSLGLGIKPFKRVIVEKNLEILKLKTEIEDKKALLKERKKEIKRLKFVLKDTIPTAKQPIPRRLGSPPESPPIPRRLGSPTKEKNKKPPSIYSLEDYARIKNYMIKLNLSLGALCKRNNLDTDKFLEKFINLKERRIKTAHPETEEIPSDRTFFFILDGY